MLDVQVVKNENGTLKFQVYRKPTHTDHYLKFTSHQPLEHKLGVVRTLRHRADVSVSNDHDKTQELDHIKKALTIAGYAKWVWDMPSKKKKKDHPQ